MTRTATAHGRRNEKVRAVLSALAVVTGTWLSGAVDRPAAESSAGEMIIGEFDDVWTVANAAPRASARHGRES